MKKFRSARNRRVASGTLPAKGRRFRQSCVGLGLTLLLAGCGGSREQFVFTGTSNNASPVVSTRALTGTISYERLLPISILEPDDGEVAPAQLDFAHPESQPCRYVRVQLIDDQNQTLDEGHTDEQGRYRFESVPLDKNVKVRALAESVALGTESAAIRVQDNTNNNAIYAAESSIVDLEEVGVLNLDLPTGYDSSGNQAPGTVRSSAPFSCLDGILTGYRYFLSGGLRAGDLPLCVVNWSELNRPEEADPDESPAQAQAEGKIGTSHFESKTNQLSILGFRGADTDEFDWHIMIHEFGHWVQFNAFRDNSNGGSHGTGDIKDPRLAFSEGFGNALGGLALSDAVYKDTTAMDGFSFSLECNRSQSDPDPGWFSEATVQTVLFDLFDPQRLEGGDSQYPDRIELPLQYFVAALTEQAQSPALTTVFSFLSGLLESGLSADQSAELSGLLAFESISADFGLNSVEEFGVGETHDASLDSLPVYGDAEPFFVAGVSPLTLPGQPEEGIYNSLQGGRFFKFIGDGSTVTITALNSSSTVGAIQMQLFEDGRDLTQEIDEETENQEGDDDDKVDSTVSGVTKPGSTYIVYFVNTSTDTSTTDIQFSRTGGPTL